MTYVLIAIAKDGNTGYTSQRFCAFNRAITVLGTISLTSQGIQKISIPMLLVVLYSNQKLNKTQFITACGLGHIELTLN